GAEKNLPLIAEDLGIITDGVRALMDKFCLPGMKVLLFAFGADIADNPYSLHNMCKNAVVYTGTHDNNTVLGWWKEETSAADRLRFRNYTGESGEFDVSFRMARMALSSVADTAVIPMQDILGLGSVCRMNTPGVGIGNWKWRMTNDELMKISDKRSSVTIKYRELNELFGRTYRVC
ncbi:MAG: 4-alpha-glucanotransferase, partial [Synergistaceae bacterium]